MNRSTVQKMVDISREELKEPGRREGLCTEIVLGEEALRLHDEVEELRAENDRLEDKDSWWRREHDRLVKQRTKLEDESERVMAANRRLAKKIDSYLEDKREVIQENKRLEEQIESWKEMFNEVVKAKREVVEENKRMGVQLDAAFSHGGDVAVENINVVTASNKTDEVQRYKPYIDTAGDENHVEHFVDYEEDPDGDIVLYEDYAKLEDLLIKTLGREAEAQLQVGEIQARCASLMAAGEMLCAAVWDGRLSGKGITGSYAESVTSEWKASAVNNVTKGPNDAE